jgi:cell division septation protein DedD
MQAHPAYAEHAAEPSARIPEAASVTTALYQAALGPVNADHYLAAFERLDATGRVLAGWNTAAALCPPGWLAFRRMWREALIYLAALAACALLLFFVAHRWLALPGPMLAGLTLAAVLVACVAPGLYGDALMHADVRRRISQAVSSAPSMREAVKLLERQASSQRWLKLVTLTGVVLALAVAVGAWAALGGRGAAEPAAQQTDKEIAPMPAQPLESAAADAPKPLPAGPSGSDAAAVPPPQGAEPLPTQPPQPPAPQQAQPPAARTQPAPEPPAQPAPAPSIQPALTPSAQPARVQNAARPAEPAPHKTPSRLSPKEPRKESHTLQQKPQQKLPQEEWKTQQHALYINVGLFADPANARRAHERLRQAGLPASMQPLVVNGRHLERVRVGPFPSAAQAHVAAAKVRALGLEAQEIAQ